MPFGEFDQFLFATGDEAKWLVASKDAVLGEPTPCPATSAAVTTSAALTTAAAVMTTAAVMPTAAAGSAATVCREGYANEARPILFSSLTLNASTAKWYNQDSEYEPWISLRDNEVAISAGDLLYGEGSNAGFEGWNASWGPMPTGARTPHASAVLPVHNLTLTPTLIRTRTRTLTRTRTRTRTRNS